MKRFVLFFFMFVFALNTVVLAASANACKMERGGVTAEQAMPDMPNCHKKSDNSQQKQGETPHCNGVCFCQHLISSHHILPFAEAVSFTHSFVKDSPASLAQRAAHFLTLSPPHRPPIFIS